MNQGNYAYAAQPYIQGNAAPLSVYPQTPAEGYYGDPGAYGEGQCDGYREYDGSGSGDYAAADGADAKKISTVICKTNARNQVVDFRTKMIPAYQEHFAQIHGVGGNKHAANSTIQCVICDYSKGKGPDSVTVYFNLEVEHTEILYEAATAASNGLLNSAGLFCTSSQVLNSMRNWTNYMSSDPNFIIIPFEELVEAGRALSGALDKSVWEYSAEKCNSHVKNEGLSPVSKISIRHKPFRDDGSVSVYPWSIRIENFDAPVTVQKSGAITYNAKQAENTKVAYINVSVQDFLRMMICVKHTVHSWEMAHLGNMKQGLAAYHEQTQKMKEAKS